MSDFDFMADENAVYTLGVGSKFPQFELDAVVAADVPSKSFATINNDTYAGKWLVVFFWPKDFTFICPTEISAFGDINDEFEKRNAQVLGGSTDSEFVHLAWRNDHPALKSLPFPMLADVKRELSEQLGIIDAAAGVCQRATFIVNPEGVIQHVSVNALDTGRNPAEILRTLEALQTGELTGCSWTPGKEVITVA